MAQNGRIVIRNCVPDGDVILGNITTGDTSTKDWTFRVNDFDPKYVTLLDSGGHDPRNVIRGYDGVLLDVTGRMLATVNAWQMRLSPNNADIQFGGDKQVMAIFQGFTATLTFTEIVIRDADILGRLLDMFAQRTPEANLQFQGEIRAHGVEADIEYST